MVFVLDRERFSDLYIRKQLNVASLVLGDQPIDGIVKLYTKKCIDPLQGIYANRGTSVTKIRCLCALQHIIWQDIEQWYNIKIIYD